MKKVAMNEKDLNQVTGGGVGAQIVGALITGPGNGGRIIAGLLHLFFRK